MNKSFFKVIFLLPLVIGFAFLNLQIAVGQNLVPNPSFEEHDSCPDFIGQIYFATGWFNSGTSTVDYFNQCSSNWGVPENSAGYQNAATGVAFGGFYAFWWPNPKYLEYLGCALTDSLAINQKYFISFKINRADFTNCAVDKIGILVTTQPYIYNGLDYNTKNFSQFYYNNFVIDTMDWTFINGSFIADSSYKYLYLGNFFCDSLTNKIILDSSNHCGSYYLVDDVCISTDSLTCYSTNGINEIYVQNQIWIYPNPTEGIFTITTKKEGYQKANISIYNSFGLLIMKSADKDINTDINISGFDSGLYFLIVTLGENMYYSKIIKY